MQNKLISNSLFSVSINLLIKSIWILGVELAIQKVLGNQVYGRYFALYNFSIFFLLFTDFGINNYNTREIASNKLQLSSFIDHLFTFKLILCALYFVVLLLASLLFKYNVDELRFFILIGIIQCLSSISLFLRSNLQGLLAFKKDAIVGISDKLMMIVGCSFFLFFQKFTPFTLQLFLYIQIGSFTITNLLGFLFLSKHVKMKLKMPDFKLYHSILILGLPFSVLFFCMSVYMRMDGVLLKKLLPNGELQAGIYAAGFRLLDAFMQITMIVSGIMLPILTRELAEKINVTETITNAISILITPAIILATIGLFFHLEMASLLYSTNINEISKVIFILLPTSIPYILSLVYGTLLTASGNFKALNIVAFSCLIINGILHFIIIPIYGYKGAAVVTGITHFISFMLLFIISTFKHKVSFSIIYIIKSIFFMGIIACLAYFVKEHWSLCLFAIWLGTTIILAFLLGLIPIKKLIEKFRRKIFKAN